MRDNLPTLLVLCPAHGPRGTPIANRQLSPCFQDNDANLDNAF
jgi:hypothetical protein